MSFEATIRESVEYMRRDDDWMKTAVIGGLLMFFSFLIVPAFVLYGYYLRVLGQTMRGDDQPPKMAEFGTLAREGIPGIVVALGYAAIPILVGALFFVLGGILRGALGALVGFVGFLVMLVLGLALAYLLPAGLASLAETGRIGSAFDVGEVLPVVTSSKYAMSWVSGILLVFVASLVSWIPIVGWAVAFYAICAWLSIMGNTWAEMHPVEFVDEGSMGEQPAV